METHISFINLANISPVIYTSLICIVSFVLFKRRSSNHVPRGPMGLPIVGYLPFLGRNPGETLGKMKSRYGRVFSISVGSSTWVVLNDLEAIKEVFVKQGDKSSGRVRRFYSNAMTKGGYGLAMSNYGEEFKTLRKFGHSALRKFGMGKPIMEEYVNEESEDLVESLARNDGEKLKKKVLMAPSNIVARMLFGSRYSYEDKDLVTINELLLTFFSDSVESKAIGLVMMCPFVRHIPWIGDIVKTQLGHCETMLGIIRKEIHRHRETLDTNHIRDFIDAFLLEMGKEKINEGAFNDKHLEQFCRDLFDAGSGTISSSISWCILALAHWPEYEQKLATEVQKVIGESGTPSMKHRDEMPFTCAFIQEIMRHRSIGPIGLVHRTMDECRVGKYKIPKNTITVANLWSVHHNPEMFPNPDQFRPERFIDAEGKFIRSNHVIPFSVGPRYCLGEVLGRTEIFLFLTNIVQKLRITKDPSRPLPPFDEGSFNGISFDSIEYNVLFHRR